MFGSLKHGASAYATVGIETGVTSASPHKLITMLFEGAMIAISSAASMMQSGDIAGKGQAISKAITIIDAGLRVSLDKKAGGEIASNLDALYEYIGMRLLIANVKNDPEILQEVLDLMKELKGAWDEIGKTEQAPVSVQAAPQTSAYDPLAPRVSNLMRA